MRLFTIALLLLGTACAQQKSEDARLEALVKIAGQGQAGCEQLVAGLTDSSADLRERAARALYANCPATVTDKVAGLEVALRKSVTMGNPSAGTLLLLGRFKSDESRKFLQQHMISKEMVKLQPWQPPVRQGLAAAVAAVSAGVPSALPAVQKGLGPLPEAEFLVSAMADLSDNSAVVSLAKLLDDSRTVQAGVPSGVQPQLRIQDLALEAFVARLKLRPSFAIRNGSRYTDAELAQGRIAIKSP